MTAKRVSWVMKGDANADQKVSLDEFIADSISGFKKKDKNSDGVVDASDL